MMFLTFYLEADAFDMVDRLNFCIFLSQVVVSPLERAYERPTDRNDGEEEDMESEETPDMETGD